VTQKNDTISHKAEAVRQLEDQIDSLKKSHLLDVDRLRRDTQEARDCLQQKEESLLALHSRFEDIIQCQVVEIPIYAGRKKAKTTAKKQSMNNRSKSQNRLKSQLQFVREMAEEEDAIDLIDDDMESIRSSNSQLQFKKPAKKPEAAVNVMPFFNTVFDLDQVVANQVLAARMAEQTLKELEEEADVKVNDLQTVLDQAQALNDKLAIIQKERDEFSALVQTV
jgi:hypothetical protein